MIYLVCRGLVFRIVCLGMQISGSHTKGLVPGIQRGLFPLLLHLLGRPGVRMAQDRNTLAQCPEKIPGAEYWPGILSPPQYEQHEHGNTTFIK